jgi:lipopolysaccharide biosynthesis glycosyltransferase
MSALPIFIGYDTREDDASKVCAHSLQSNSSEALFIQHLHEPSLRHIGLYSRQWTADGAQKFDVIDGKPFSTSFSFSRFLVPSLMQHRGWAMFVDCDFLFTADVAQLFAMADPTKAVMVVKHEMPEKVSEKMDGQRQEPYTRKNWSSLMLWNCAHPANQRLVPDKVNTMSGQWLHRFSWLDDDQIGDLPQDWNWLAGVQAAPESGKMPCAIHHTLGVPSMAGHENEPYADLWWAVLNAARQAGK